MMDDNTIIQECRQGNTNAFSEIVNRYQDKLYNTIYRLVNKPEDTLDICQDVFVKAFKNINSFRGEASFMTYLYRIAFNECITYRNKRQKNKEKVEMDRLNEGLDRQSDDPPEENKIDAQEQNEYIQNALNSLAPPELKEVVILKDIEGLSYAEVSKALNISVSTVRTNLDKARQILRHKLKNLL